MRTTAEGAQLNGLFAAHALSALSDASTKVRADQCVPRESCTGLPVLPYEHAYVESGESNKLLTDCQLKAFVKNAEIINFRMD